MAYEKDAKNKANAIRAAKQAGLGYGENMTIQMTRDGDIVPHYSSVHGEHYDVYVVTRSYNDDWDAYCKHVGA